MAELRAFIGLPVQGRLADAIADWIPSVSFPRGANLRLSPRANWHVTLHFFGAKTDEARLHEAWNKCLPIFRKLAAVEVEPQSLVGLPMHHSNAWVIALEPTYAMLELQSRLCAQLQALDFSIEDRPYFPHITLWRPKGKQHIDLPCFDVDLPAATLGTVALYQSVSQPGGSVYTMLDQYRLAH